MAAPTLELLDGVVARLTERLPGLAVALVPESDTAPRLLHPAGAVLVSYGAARFSHPGSQGGPWRDSSAVAQRREVLVSLLVQARQLHGATGAVAVLDQVRAALLGWRPPHGGPLRGEAERLLNAEDGLWSYGVTYVTDTLAVVDDEVESGPPLVRLTTIDDAATSVTITRAADGSVTTEQSE